MNIRSIFEAQTYLNKAKCLLEADIKTYTTALVKIFWNPLCRKLKLIMPRFLANVSNVITFMFTCKDELQNYTIINIVDFGWYQGGRSLSIYTL